MPNNSPNMNLPIPVPGVDSGLVWETSLVSCLNLIDQHMHSPGYGVTVNQSGISLTGPLSLSSQNLTNVGSVVLTQLASPISSSILSVLYSGNGATGDLYYNDGAGNQIRITSGGAVNATSSGISSGTATASFSAGVLVVNQAANTPGNIQCGSVLLGNNVAASNFVTLSPPNSLGASYQITLPTGLPASQSVLTLDNSGNVAAPAVYPLTGSSIASNVNLPGKNTQAASQNLVVSSNPATNGLMIVRGRVNSASTILQGEGFSVAIALTGEYQITFSAAFLENPTIVASVEANAADYCTVSSVSTTQAFVYTRNSSGSLAAIGFNFIAIGQRA